MNPSPGPWRWSADDRLVDADGKGVSLEVNKALFAAIPEMREMLLRHEWSGAHDDNGPGCPECGAGINHALVFPNGVHRAGCALAALLDRIR